MTSKRSLVNNTTSQISASDGRSAAGYGNAKPASSDRYAMLKNIVEDDEMEDNNQQV